MGSQAEEITQIKTQGHEEYIWRMVSSNCIGKMDEDEVENIGWDRILRNLLCYEKDSRKQGFQKFFEWRSNKIISASLK